MKILKPGKVEQRKFVCPMCGCIFACDESDKDTFWDEDDLIVPCPTCGENSAWANGKPYEEHTPTQTNRERLVEIVRDSSVWIEFERDEAVELVVDQLLANGVTFGGGPC